MPIAARRTFRLAFTVALALLCGYAMALPLPFLPPVFAFLVASKPSAPIGLKGLVGLVLVVLLTLGSGLLLTPVLEHYPVIGLAMVMLGIFVANQLALVRGKALLGLLLTIGLTLITAAGQLSYTLASMVVDTIALSMAIAILCWWLVYPWFPEDPSSESAPAEPATNNANLSNWLAARATVVLFPAYLLALINPAAYMPVVIKSAMLSQQADVISTRAAGRELLGSTFLGGCFAVLFWFGLKLWPSLGMFGLWMLLFGIYFSAKLYGIYRSRFPASFWQNTAVTLLILLGPAVEDSANGKDVYQGFLIRMALFLLVALYAWLAISLLENWRNRRLKSGDLNLKEAKC